MIHDHVGFGFSDKPRKNFTYSIFEHADVATKLWTNLGVKNAILVAHDMGDSIVGEILSRRSRGLLISPLSSEIKGVVFTNGGMKIELSNFRISQSILKSPFGPFMNWLASDFEIFFRQQLISIWSPTYEDLEQRDADIKAIIELSRYRSGHKIAHKTIRYLHDRYNFEYRWLDAIASLDLPCLILWGDSDAVAPISIAHHVHHTSKGQCRVKTLTGVGHFLMLEAPGAWAEEILGFLRGLLKQTLEF